MPVRTTAQRSPTAYTHPNGDSGSMKPGARDPSTTMNQTAAAVAMILAVHRPPTDACDGPYVDPMDPSGPLLFGRSAAAADQHPEHAGRDQQPERHGDHPRPGVVHLYLYLGLLGFPRQEFLRARFVRRACHGRTSAARHCRANAPESARIMHFPLHESVGSWIPAERREGSRDASGDLGCPCGVRASLRGIIVGPRGTRVRYPSGLVSGRPCASATRKPRGSRWQVVVGPCAAPMDGYF